MASNQFIMASGTISNIYNNRGGIWKFHAHNTTLPAPTTNGTSIEINANNIGHWPINHSRRLLLDAGKNLRNETCKRCLKKRQFLTCVVNGSSVSNENWCFVFQSEIGREQMLLQNKTKERDVGVYTRYVCTGISENKREPPKWGPSKIPLWRSLVFGFVLNVSLRPGDRWRQTI